MENEVINTLQDGEPVTSTYAEIYFPDGHCDYQRSPSSSIRSNAKVKYKTVDEEDEGNSWVSPSDQLIGIIDLKPPFTSKITRGKAHEGLLAIGNDLLVTERAKFIKYLTELLHENDCAWNMVLMYEKSAVAKKVKAIYEKILEDKTKLMTKEIMKFYEETLQEMENNIRTQLKDVLMSTHASMVSQMNTEIKQKLQSEKKILEGVLKKRYNSEVAKMKKYYRLLLINEKQRSRQLINRVIIERNDAVKAFMRQIEAENTSATMYVMSTERKKCKVKQFIMDNYYQSRELKEKHEKLKQRQDIINIFKSREEKMTQINSEWETKIKKILELFLKFISFSLKLLPEQTTFLLNFEKMVVLQLNEIQKAPFTHPNILVDTDTLDNTFKFEKLKEEKEECTKEPFVIEGGNLSGTPSTQYGSRETLPDDADLPVVRVQRQFVYARCHHYEDIKARLERERCKCLDFKVIKPPAKPKSSVPVKPSVEKPPQSSSSDSVESLIIGDIRRYNTCPARNCQDWINKSPFPYLNDYLDFDDKKLARVTAILGKPKPKKKLTKFIEPKDIVYRELPFARTKEPTHTVETQYSSEENLVPDINCPCVDDYFPQRRPSSYRLQESPSQVLMANMTKRKISLRRLFQENPDLMKTLTDESFDFVY